MRVNLMTIWSAIFVLLGVHSVWTRHLPWIIYPSPLWSCHKSRSDPVQQSIWTCRLLKWGHFPQGGDEFRNICLSPYTPYWYHSLSPFPCMWRPCDWETVADLSFIGSFGHWNLNLSNVIFTISGTMSPISRIFEARENKSDDLPVMHYQTRRINSKVIHLTICEKSRFAALALPWRTCASLCPSHRSLDCLFKIMVWKHPNFRVLDLVICNKLFLILLQYPYQIVSMPFATRNHVSQHYHCSKITLVLYSWDVIISIHYFGCRGVNLPLGESRFAVSPL